LPAFFSFLTFFAFFSIHDCFSAIACTFSASLELHQSRVTSPSFSTIIHKFAQTFSSISIDAANSKVYLPHQIEPEA